MHFIFTLVYLDTARHKTELCFEFFQVVTLRTVHEQLTHLLSIAECQQLRTSEAFLPFSGLNPLHYNPYTEPLWRAAVVQYEKAMMPAEQKIAGKLRDQFRQLSAHSHQVSLKFTCILVLLLGQLFTYLRLKQTR